MTTEEKMNAALAAMVAAAKSEIGDAPIGVVVVVVGPDNEVAVGSNGPDARDMLDMGRARLDVVN